MRRANPAAATAAGAFGLLWFVALGGAPTLDPTRLGWTMKADFAQSVFGWLFFRQVPLGLPLGVLPNLVFPVGTSVAFTDSIPWLAAALRPLSGLLPTDFQYLGVWLALCFVLEGVAGAVVVSRLTPRPLEQALGGALLAASPVLWFRLIHPGLCAQWLVLWMLALHLTPAAGGPQARRLVAGAAAACAVAAGVHPYLAAMTLVLALALVGRLWLVDGAVSLAGAGAAGAGVAAATAAVLALFGLFATGASGRASGAGDFGSDLLALLEPLGSRWLPNVTITGGQYEGFAFLGAGGVLLALLALGALASGALRPTWPPRRLVPLLLACGALWVFALSATVRVAGHVAARIDYGWLRPLAETFRASGRFVWPLHYLVLAGLVAVPLALARRTRLAAAPLLALALAAQVADPNRGLTAHLLQSANWTPPSAAAWEGAAGRYRHLALVPPEIYDGSGAVCRPVVYTRGYSAPLAYAAYRAGLTVNSGVSPRIDRPRTQAYCARLRADVAAGRLDADTIYVPHASMLPAFHHAGAVCGRADGYDVCVAASATGSFAARLRAAREG